jgi:uncharacterized protein
VVIMANRLADSTSPYLLQHADNPVDWRPWGDDAFAEARERDVPVFLSIGYSSCHWCHVMAHESFEDTDVAALLNECFVNVKVDREERPDVDAVYMQAVTAMTGRGGWPASLFLTPDRKPFFAGTYWPPEPRHGMPGFPQVVEAVSEAWRDRRDEVRTSADQIVGAIAEAAGRDAAHGSDASGSPPDAGQLAGAARLVLERAWDRTNGGFGAAPKFPQAMTVEWLLHHHARTGDPDALEAATQALDAMARGGIHDQLAGGFARYSTDAAWLVPHFEKMLYDNALLLPAYATAAALTGRDDLAEVARRTAAYLLGELRGDDGLFVSATDADSEGAEGRYFVWAFDELVETAREVEADPSLMSAWLGARPEGNWEGVNVLHHPTPRDRFVEVHGLDPDAFRADWNRMRAALLARRARRVPPGVDHKVLTDWNALTVRGLAVAGRLLDEPGWIDAARATLHALEEAVVVDGRVHHVVTDGRVAVPGMLDDHALLALACLEMLTVDGDARWLERATDLADEVDARFRDPDGGWFTTAADGEQLVVRPKATWDNATPAGSSVMVEVCVALADVTGEHRWQARAEHGLAALAGTAAAAPTGSGWLLRVVEGLVGERRQVAVVGPPGDDRARLASVVWTRPRPDTRSVIADAGHADRVPLLAHRHGVDGGPAAYVCRGLVCDRPVTTSAELVELLDGERPGA